MGRGMRETNERSRQESGNVESIVPSPARFCQGWDVGAGGTGVGAEGVGGGVINAEERPARHCAKSLT